MIILGLLWAQALGILNRELVPWCELGLGPNLFGRVVAARVPGDEKSWASVLGVERQLGFEIIFTA